MVEIYDNNEKCFEYIKLIISLFPDLSANYSKHNQLINDVESFLKQRITASSKLSKSQFISHQFLKSLVISFKQISLFLDIYSTNVLPNPKTSAFGIIDFYSSYFDNIADLKEVDQRYIELVKPIETLLQNTEKDNIKYDYHYEIVSKFNCFKWVDLYFYQSIDEVVFLHFFERKYEYMFFIPLYAIEYDLFRFETDNLNDLLRNQMLNYFENSLFPFNIFSLQSKDGSTLLFNDDDYFSHIINECDFILTSLTSYNAFSFWYNFFSYSTRQIISGVRSIYILLSQLFRGSIRFNSFLSPNSRYDHFLKDVISTVFNNIVIRRTFNIGIEHESGILKKYFNELHLNIGQTFNFGVKGTVIDILSKYCLENQDMEYQLIVIFLIYLSINIADNRDNFQILESYPKTNIPSIFISLYCSSIYMIDHTFYDIYLELKPILRIKLGKERYQRIENWKYRLEMKRYHLMMFVPHVTFNFLKDISLSKEKRSNSQIMQLVVAFLFSMSLERSHEMDRSNVIREFESFCSSAAIEDRHQIREMDGSKYKLKKERKMFSIIITKKEALELQEKFNQFSAILQSGNFEFCYPRMTLIDKNEVDRYVSQMRERDWYRVSIRVYVKRNGNIYFLTNSSLLRSNGKKSLKPKKLEPELMEPELLESQEIDFGGPAGDDEVPSNTAIRKFNEETGYVFDAEMSKLRAIISQFPDQLLSGEISAANFISEMNDGCFVHDRILDGDAKERYYYVAYDLIANANVNLTNPQFTDPRVVAVDDLDDDKWDIEYHLTGRRPVLNRRYFISADLVQPISTIGNVKIDASYLMNRFTIKETALDTIDSYLKNDLNFNQ